MTLTVLAVGEAILVAPLLDDLGGHNWIAPAVCVLIVAASVAVLRAARRRSADDPNGARALVVLGAGLAFAALSATSLLLAVFSTI